VQKIVQITETIDLCINQDLLFYKIIAQEQKIISPQDLSGFDMSIKNQIYRALYLSNSTDQAMSLINEVLTQSGTQPTFLSKYKQIFDQAINSNEFNILNVFGQ
jgi:hypothetical protein